MENEEYKKALGAAEKDLQGWLRLRAAADQKIVQLKSAVAILSELLENPPQEPKDEMTEETGDSGKGITDAIRQVLKFAGSAATPTDVKAALINAGFDLSKYANPGAVIHNTLKRLEAQNEVITVRTLAGLPAYALTPESLHPSISKETLEALAAGFYRGFKGPTLLTASDEELAQMLIRDEGGPK